MSASDTPMQHDMTEEPKIEVAIEARFSEPAEGDELTDQLRRANIKLCMQLEAMRGDFSARFAEHQQEMKVHCAAVQASQEELDAVLEELRETRNATKDLKSQNLKLQYHLNAWGIPISNGEDDGIDELHQKGSNRFFSPIVPLHPGMDPAPIELRGDISTFHLTSLLSFLENSNLVGVLTVVGSEAATKLYVEGGALRLVAWNNRDPSYSLTRLLVASELLTEEEVESYHEENLYDLEVANRILFEGRLSVEIIRQCLREHTRVIITKLFQASSGAFFFQQGRPSCEKALQFRLPITDLLLRTASHLDEETRQPVDDLSDLPGLSDLADLEELEDIDA